MKKARFQGWLGLTSEVGRAALVGTVVAEIMAMGLVLSWVDGNRDMVSIPALLAMVVLTVMHMNGRLLLAPQEPLAEPVKPLPEGLVVRLENWGGGHTSAATSIVVALVAFAVAALGGGWALTTCLALAAVGIAVAGRMAAEQVKWPGELRLTAHALEVWRDRVWDGSPKRRLRILLHEIAQIEEVVDVDLSEQLPEGARCRWLSIIDERGGRTELRLPMGVEAANGFVAQLRELVASARDVEPDEEALSKLRYMGRRAQRTH